jgi:hypothetical protein
MKQNLIIATILLSFLFSCKEQGNKTRSSEVIGVENEMQNLSRMSKNQGNKTENFEIIDIESGLQNLSRLKISDFGKTIRYIPLETTDVSLIGRSPVVKVLRNHVIVEYKISNSSSDPGICLLFNKDDGRFIAKIGHAGQDPEAYTNSFSWTDEKEEFLYFERMPNQLIKYDMKGNFCGKVEFSFSGLASYYLINDFEIIGYFDGLSTASNQFVLAFFERDGLLKDTILSLFPKTLITDELLNISIMRGNTSYIRYGNWTRAGAISIEYKNNTRQIIASNAARIWKNNEKVSFKQDFVDTIFSVTDGMIIPTIAFHTGKFHWPVQEKTSNRNNNERIFIADISENNNFIFFQCVTGMYSSEPVLYNGLYNKKTRETKLSKNSNVIEDDLTNLMPFKPLGISTSGEFVSLVEVWEVMDWLEKNPEAKNNERLSFLNELDEDMNPIVILIE